MQPMIPIRVLKPCQSLAFFDQPPDSLLPHSKCGKVLHTQRAENFSRKSEYLEPCLQLASFGFFTSGYFWIWTLGCKRQNPTETSKIEKIGIHGKDSGEELKEELWKQEGSWNLWTDMSIGNLCCPQYPLPHMKWVLVVLFCHTLEFPSCVEEFSIFLRKKAKKYFFQLFLAPSALQALPFGNTYTRAWIVPQKSEWHKDHGVAWWPRFQRKHPALPVCPAVGQCSLHRHVEWPF